MSLLASPVRALRRAAVLVTMLIVAVFATAGWVDRTKLLHYLAHAGSASTVYPTQSHPSGMFATTTASVRPKDPFEGTPAKGLTDPIPAAV